MQIPLADMFSPTSKTAKNQWICSFGPISEPAQEMGINLISSCHIETVCLLSNTQSKKKESYITLDVEMADYYRIKNEGKNSTTDK